MCVYIYIYILYIYIHIHIHHIHTPYTYTYTYTIYIHHIHNHRDWHFPIKKWLQSSHSTNARQSVRGKLFDPTQINEILRGVTATTAKPSRVGLQSKNLKPPGDTWQLCLRHELRSNLLYRQNMKKRLQINQFWGPKSLDDQIYNLIPCSHLHQIVILVFTDYIEERCWPANPDSMNRGHALKTWDGHKDLQKKKTSRLGPLPQLLGLSHQRKAKRQSARHIRVPALRGSSSTIWNTWRGPRIGHNKPPRNSMVGQRTIDTNIYNGLSSIIRSRPGGMTVWQL